MNSFVNAIQTQEARTENGMKAYQSTNSSAVDLFFKIGSSRNTDIIPAFVKAFVDSPDTATRIALWSRDIRGGAGERKTFRSIVSYLSKNNPEQLKKILHKIPELGRWDDLLSVEGDLRKDAFQLIKNGLSNPDTSGLVSKWMPRQGKVAAELRNFFGWSPKRYRKTLVGLTNVVETPMCAKQYEKINYQSVPSVAAARYQKAFMKNDKDRYTSYVQQLKNGKTTINASAVYPYDVIRSLRSGNIDVANAQWDSLPDYVNGRNILPLVDVSGSMTCAASGSITCLDVALSLGLYLSDKNKGAFKDTFLTFSMDPELMTLKGSLYQKMSQMTRSKWEMNTNLHKAFDKILHLAVTNRVPQNDMPEMLLILSDMQFDNCISYDDTAYQMIQRKYNEAGYVVPNIIFWNINSRYNNVPIQFKEQLGVSMVSGFSPAIMKSILSSENITPESVMMKTIMNNRYDF